MTHRLHIIVTCTKRKTAIIPPQLMLHDVRGATVAERWREWKSRLASTSAPQVPVEKLYAGDHWTVARSLPGVAKAAGYDPSLWVISTGFGLIKSDAMLVPYSATFSCTHRDTVLPPRFSGDADGAFSQWWKLMSEWDGRVGPPVKSRAQNVPRSIEALARMDPAASFLIVASAAYLSAVRDDLDSAVKQLDDDNRLAVVSAGTKDLGERSELLLPLDARLQSSLGGARRSLNIRMAKRLLEREKLDGPPLDRGELRDWCRLTLEDAKPLEKNMRSRASDEQVIGFIQKQVAKAPQMKFTPMLDLFRNSGFMCEQRRFHEMYRRISSKKHG